MTNPPASRTWDELTAVAMGSRATVIIGDAPAGAGDWALSRLVELERCWSRFLGESELCELNRSAGRWFPMSDTMALAVDRAFALHHSTDGRFDPTVLMSLTGLGYDRPFADLDRASIKAAAPTGPAPGLAGTERDGEWIRLPVGVEIDLGGLGKGLAADLIAEELIARGATSVCVSMGGDLRVAGRAPEGGWPIPLSDPCNDGATLATLQVSEGALVTSTTAYRRWSRRGEAHHHLIDPSTGASAMSGVQAGIVAAGNAWFAEGIAKAALIAGVSEGRALIERNGAVGWLVTDDGLIHPTAGAPDLGLQRCRPLGRPQQ